MPILLFAYSVAFIDPWLVFRASGHGVEGLNPLSHDGVIGAVAHGVPVTELAKRWPASAAALSRGSGCAGVRASGSWRNDRRAISHERARPPEDVASKLRRERTGAPDEREVRREEYRPQCDGRHDGE